MSWKFHNIVSKFKYVRVIGYRLFRCTLTLQGAKISDRDTLNIKTTLMINDLIIKTTLFKSPLIIRPH